MEGRRSNYYTAHEPLSPSLAAQVHRDRGDTWKAPTMQLSSWISRRRLVWTLPPQASHSLLRNALTFENKQSVLSTATNLAILTVQCANVLGVSRG